MFVQAEVLLLGSILTSDSIISQYFQCRSHIRGPIGKRTGYLDRATEQAGTASPGGEAPRRIAATKRDFFRVGRIN